MANEVNTLNIGGTSYPIYSEGIKVDSSTTGGSFLISGGTGNRKIGVSNAISGNDESLTINSGDIYLGESANSLSLGQYATYIYIGEEATDVYLGFAASNVSLGDGAAGISLGDGAAGISLGYYANNIYIGEGANSVSLGQYATYIYIGEEATDVYLGSTASNVYLGESATSVSLGYGKTTTAENGVVTKHTTTKIGENNLFLYAGQSATYVYLGESADNVSIGESATYVYLGESAFTVSIGESATGVYLGESANNVSIGAGATGVYLGQDAGFIYIGKEATSVYLGESAGNVSIGARATGVYLGGNATNVYLGGNASNIYIGDPYGDTHTGMIRMQANDFNVIVTPNTSTVNGFNILHQNNSNVGVVFYTPMADVPVLYITPRTAYASNRIVHLGTTSKRFGYIYTTYGKATNGFTTDSDERLKDFGEDIEVDLDALTSLRKRYYRWNETSGFENEKDRMIGMSAQEVQKIYPEIVEADEDGYLSMSYERLSVIALAAIDKLHETNKQLKAENEDLKDRIANLENLVDTILSRIN